MRLSGRRLLLGITGGIAAYKIPNLVRLLRQEKASLKIILTKAAEAFVSPLTLETLARGPVYLQSDFLRPQQGFIPHTDLGRWAELILVAPATASFLANLRLAEASSLLVATILASGAKVLLFPAMNEKMWSHPATQENISCLREWGYTVIPPEEGELACGEKGPGRLPSEEVILSWARRLLGPGDLSGVKVLVTMGPTREPLDAVRYLSNRSSGKMGLALAQEAFERGAEVTVIHGPVCLPLPPLFKTIQVETAQEMKEAVLTHLEEADILMMVAAVSDYQPEAIFSGKIKKGRDLSLKLRPTPDILKEVSSRRTSRQIIVGFAAEESRHLLSEARRKLEEKKLDLIVANPIDQEGAGFETSTNEVLLLTRKGEEKAIPLLPKREVAEKIWDQVVALWKEKTV